MKSTAQGFQRSRVFFCVLAYVQLLTSGACLAQEGINIGCSKQLFCDDKVIAAMTGVARQINPPEPIGPVLIPEYPWENRCLSYFCVMEDQGQHKMWYGCYEETPRERRICYATSADGLNWEKPFLGLVDYNGSLDNNIVPVDFDDGGAIFIDPLAPAESRYKILGIRPVLYLYESADGVGFVPVDKQLLDFIADTHNQMFYDDRLNTYVAYLRSWNFLPSYDGGAIRNRTVSRLETSNPTDPWPFNPVDSPFYKWGPGNSPAISTELDVVMALDSLDPPDADIYNPCVIKYVETDDAYFAFPSIYYHLPAPPEGDFYYDGTLNIELAFSRDGIDWTRFRTPYIDTNCCGERLQQMYMAQGMLRVGDYFYQYFNGIKETHGDSLKTSKYHCVRQRVDGFVSLDASVVPGTVRTHRLLFEGNTLQINYVAQADGYVLVELLDSGGVPISGFTFEESDTLRGDELVGAVSWIGNRDIGSLEGTPVCLNIIMKNAKLFSLRFLSDPMLSVSESEEIDISWALGQNYPNPFNPETTIKYHVPGRVHVCVEVFNILGQRVRTLVDEVKPAGEYTVTWNGSGDSGKPVTSGIYFYRMQAGDFVDAKKITLLR